MPRQTPHHHLTHIAIFTILYHLPGPLPSANTASRPCRVKRTDDNVGGHHSFSSIHYIFGGCPVRELLSSTIPDPTWIGNQTVRSPQTTSPWRETVYSCRHPIRPTLHRSITIQQHFPSDHAFSTIDSIAPCLLIAIHFIRCAAMPRT